MAGLFLVTGALRERRLLWFVNRCKEPGGFALDELFTESEAAALQGFLKRRSRSCRIEKVERPPRPEELPSYNCLGPIFELAPEEAAELPFTAVGCVES